MSKQIVVIGAGPAAISFINKAAPSLKNGQITLIDPGLEFLWPVGAVRGFVSKEFTEKIFRPIADISKKHANVKVVKQRATGINVADKQVQTGDGQSIGYDFLVIASGSSNSTPWKKDESSQDPSVALRSSLAQFQTALSTAKKVVIAGAGPIGVESSAEIKERYPDTEVILINAHSRLMEASGWSEGVGNSLAGQLKSLGVEVRHNLKTTSPKESSTTPTTVDLSDGSTIQADVFVSATGLRPNTDFVPAELLDEKKFVKTTATLQSSKSPYIFVIGDAASFTRKFAHVSDTQGALAAQNVITLVGNPSATNLKTYGGDTSGFMGVVQVGTKGGSGQMGWIRFPSFMVKMIKAQTLFTENIPKMFD